MNVLLESWGNFVSFYFFDEVGGEIRYWEWGRECMDMRCLEKGEDLK